MGGFKDTKDIKEKELKEFKEKDKEFKEKDKEFKEIKEKDKDIVEQPVLPQPAAATEAAGPAMTLEGAVVGLMQRVERIEKHLGIGKAFIEGAERPSVDDRALGDDDQ